MIIILEGPDGAGKTTLAKELMQVFNLEYHHEGPPPLDVPPLEHYGKVLDAMRGKNVVVDRLAFGERIYGPIIRTHDRLGHNGWVVFKRLMNAVGALHVICLPPLSAALAAWRHRKELAGELITDESRFLTTYGNYGYYASRRDYVDFVYDYTSTDAYDRLLYTLDGPDVKMPPRVVGMPDAEHLIVGERVTHHDQLDLPFFSTGGCAAYLSQALAQADIFEEDVAWANVYRADGTLEDAETFKRNGMGVPYSRVLALGEVVQAALQRLGVAHTPVAHPRQWLLNASTTAQDAREQLAAYAQQLAATRVSTTFTLKRREM